MNELNPTGIKGIAFVEYAPAKGVDFEALFTSFGFSKTRKHATAAVDYFQQGDIRFLVNSEPNSFAASFAAEHGPSVCGLALHVEDAAVAYQTAVARGARPLSLEGGKTQLDLPAVEGIGGSALYFVDKLDWFGAEFAQHPAPALVEAKGFKLIDHLTNNVRKGTLEDVAGVYKSVFGFTEVRHFDIRGEQTGLYSYALRSPCKSFCIPINEGTEEKSQIEEYLREYNGPGIQHIALLSDDLLASLDAMKGAGVEFLDIDDEYYAEVFDRVPNVTEDHGRIKGHQVLVDGDDEGYLLQIFTQNIIGPVFFELIQRKNHLSFGEGNFGALFRSIERDQQRRGVLD